MLLLIDNFDSFTHNLARYFVELGAQVEVVRNNQISLSDIEHLAPAQLVISPGPCTPTDAGISLAAIKHFAGTVPLLGVCLGHQAIGQAFGGKVIGAKEIRHGKVSQIVHRQQQLFKALPTPFNATRYHSLVVEPTTLPSCFKVDAWCEHQHGYQEIMAISHCDFPLWGVQFHPESLLTEHGHGLLENFLLLSDSYNAARV
ncbi:aminodeoxychorismate/anthranilate synthase component II [Alteromonas pelagimontana]|uniref:Aminodeoxychorismate/anthranilate synthase component II n=1 Tax=Alteromonas pelagimontana TaxID=1858656 RepID=A0A6M4MDB7_9ALTE|nr:aminodeoxychorismate/anthranilate synthase component II [Alteromonas pelagimontana]QJR80565.1 aminodeoxychorismate/anthranilate synthase component II [Alteromonas pelagimontana]